MNDDTESEAGDDTDDDNDDMVDNEDGHSSDTSDESSPIHDKGVKTESGNSQTSKTKIKPLCETRWVERHTTLQDFEDLYEPLLVCLEEISMSKGSKTWDSHSKTEAQGLLYQIHSSTFIAAFHSARYLLGYTQSLSQSLQGSTTNIINFACTRSASIY